MRSRFAAALVIAVASVIATSCGGIVAPSKNQTETFSGTLDPRGTRVHGFSVSKSGEFTATISSLTPPVNVFLSMVFGQATQTGCAPLQQYDFAIAGRQSLGGAITPGSWCVAIADFAGALTTPVSYQIAVAHP